MTKYQKKQITRIAMLTAILAVVLLSYIITRTLNVNLNEHMSSFQDGFVIGFGISVLFFIIYLAIQLKDENKLKETMIIQNDERNVALMQKAMVRTFYMIIIGLVFAILVCSFYSVQATWLLLYVLCASLVTYFINAVIEQYRK